MYRRVLFLRFAGIGRDGCQVSGVLSYYSDLGTQSLGGTSFACVWANPVRPTTGRVLRRSKSMSASGWQYHAGRAVHGRKMSCAGNCAVSPAVMFDGSLWAVVPSKFHHFWNPR
jgi:hypothetical protein